MDLKYQSSYHSNIHPVILHYSWLPWLIYRFFKFVFLTVVRLEAPVLMWIKYEDIHLANLWQLPSPFICIFWNTMHKLHFYRKYILRFEIKLARGITLHDTITTFNDIQKKDMLGKNECGLMKQYSGCFIKITTLKYEVLLIIKWYNYTY